MTGKQLKEWSSTLSDDCVIEISQKYGIDRYERLEPQHLRAVQYCRAQAQDHLLDVEEIHD